MKHITLVMLLAAPAYADGVGESGSWGLTETGPGGTATADIDLDTGGYQLILDAGTQTNPAWVFGDDDDGTGTGAYRVGANSIGWTTNGTVKLSLSNSYLTMYTVLFNLNGSLIYDSTDALELGTACTGGATGDVCTGGAMHLESTLGVTGQTTFDGLVRYNGANVIRFYDTGGNLSLYFATEPDDGFHIAPDNTDGQGNNNVILVANANKADDYDHSTPSANPTFIGHSQTAAASATDQWWSITHDQTDGVIDVGTGDLKLADEVEATGVSGDGAGKAVCVKADGNLGTCTDAVGAGGTCTCT